MTVVLVVVLECQQLWNNNTKKIRFTWEQLKNGERSGDTNCTGRLVTCGIMEWVEQELGQPLDWRRRREDKSLSEEEEYPFQLEVYCPKQHMFRSVLEESVQQCDMVQTFGSRIKCSLVLPSNSFIEDSSPQHVQPPPPLAITGRFFDYDPMGMMIFGKQIVVKEVPNNQVDGTGLNVWDGALLL